MLGEPNCKGEQMDSTCCFIARELNITAALAAHIYIYIYVYIFRERDAYIYRYVSLLV